jgi:tetratricopeptide (TPR) repeat protein
LKLNAGSFEEAQRLLAQLGVGREHVHAATYFATRILYQRGKLDLRGVIARLQELLRACPDFPEAEAMLRAAERGTLQPDPRGFHEATIPPPESPARDTAERHTDIDDAALSDRPIEARLETPKAPGIPKAPHVPRFTPRLLPPSYAPEPELDLTPPIPSLELEVAPARPEDIAETVPTPPPSEPSQPPVAPDLPPVAIELGLAGGRRGLLTRTTAPSPGAQGPSEAPSVFQIATWLSERDFERALGAIDELGNNLTPELLLLQVRALVGLGRRARARRSLDRLCDAPLIEPDLRAAAARLLVELGDLDRAEAQARRAHREDPESELARVTLGWALLRRHGWQLPARAGQELEELLSGLNPESCSLPSLSLSLTAHSALHAGLLESGRAAAERALTIDPASADALAALTLSALAEQDRAAADKWLSRLANLHAGAADELEQVLAARGTPLERSRPVAAEEPAGPPLWDELERRLASGDRAPAQERFERELERILEPIPEKVNPSELSFAAMLTARYLTTSFVCRHFAPFDLSLFSVARIDAALSLLYGRGEREPTRRKQRVLLALGAYAGECLRQAYAGEWLGDAGDLTSLHVEGQGLCFMPFRDMQARMTRGQSLHMADAPPRQHPGAEPFGQRVELDVAPPCPWDPEAWPSHDSLPALGRSLADCAIGAFCQYSLSPLDRSLDSLRSLDRYVALLAPENAPPDPQAPWIKRAAVLVGAYVGETLRHLASARWETASSVSAGPERFVLRLHSGARHHPVAAAWERLSGRSGEMPSAYARRIMG